jgi:hypothetical protein
MLIAIIISAIIIVWFVAYKESESDESFSDEEQEFMNSYRAHLMAQREKVEKKINDIHKIVKK